MFKQSFKKTKLDASTQILVDSGYQGMGRYHVCCKLPLKETKLGPLTEEQKLANRQLAKIRIVIKHVIGRLKFLRFLPFATEIAVSALLYVSTLLLLLYIIN